MRRSLLAAALAALLGAAPAFAQKHSADTSASALHWAAYDNDLGAARRLLAEGADPNAANRFGVTPLHEAATVGNAEMLKAMLEAGGNADAAFGEGETVLMTAARAGNAESVRLLLEHGADVNASEHWHGQTALMWAAMENHAEVVQLLIDAGAQVDRASTKHDWVKISYSEGNVPKTRDLGGLTALQFAAREGSLESVEKLLAAGAEREDLDDAVGEQRDQDEVGGHGGEHAGNVAQRVDDLAHRVAESDREHAAHGEHGNRDGQHGREDLVHRRVDVDQVHARCRHHHVAGREVRHADHALEHHARFGADDLVVLGVRECLDQLGPGVGAGMDELRDLLEEGALVFLVGGARRMRVGHSGGAGRAVVGGPIG